MKGKLINPRNYVPSPGERVPGVSETVPNEALSIKEILRRFTKGMPLDVLEKEGAYDEHASFDSIDLEKLKHADLYEQMEVLDKMKLVAQEKRKELDDELARQVKERLDKEKEEQEVRELLKSSKKKKKDTGSDVEAASE